MPKQRLELTWIGKNNRPKLEPRILIEDPEKSFGDPDTENMLIHGDNLLALKALEQEYSGKVKCIYIDPPFNTGEMFEHYEDGLEHSIWLTQIRDRLQYLHRLLSEQGTLFIHIDDNELAYVTVVADEVFGRNNRKYVVTFKQGSATGHKAINPGCVSTTNFLLIYSKDSDAWDINRVYRSTTRDARYSKFIPNIDAHYTKWQIITLIEAFAHHEGLTQKEAKKLAKREPSRLDAFVMENARKVVRDARPDYRAVSAEARAMIDLSRQNPEDIFYLERRGYSDMYFKRGERILFYEQKMKTIDGTLTAAEPISTLWDDILSNNLHNEGDVSFPKGKKPEYLLKRCIELTTNPGDIVFDSFLGSGTTAAVAHKMGRRWIGIELGDHCYTHCKPRLDKVVSGEDQGGISKAVEWKGGGGYRFYELAPSLLNKDSFGNWVINKKYNADMLAAAMAKHEGFRYSPDPEVYWKQGKSTERDFIFTTTEFFSQEHLDHIESQMSEGESLLICCKAFNADDRRFPNVTIKKIPQILMGKCEFGKEDYSLNIVNVPFERDIQDLQPDELSDSELKPHYVAGQQELFDLEDGDE